MAFNYRHNRDYVIATFNNQEERDSVHKIGLLAFQAEKVLCTFTV